jgi:hypothetical protein
MATGPEHYSRAEYHLITAASIETDGHDDSMSAWHQRQAQAHATLALAAGTAPWLASGHETSAAHLFTDRDVTR